MSKVSAFKIFSSAVLAIAFTLSSRVIFATSEELVIRGEQRERLEQILSSFIHDTGLATLAGFKPFSILVPENPDEVVNFLDQARANGLIQNQNLGWFVDPATLRSTAVYINGVISRNVVVGNTYLYNQEAVTRLLADSSVQSLFNENGIEGVIDLASAKEALLGRFSVRGGVTFEHELLIGVLLGYPKEDVLAFAQAADSRRANFPRTPFEISDNRRGVTIYNDRETMGWNNGIYLSGFMLFSDQNLGIVEQMQRDAKLAVARYREAVRMGLRPSQIINQWNSLPIPRAIHCDLLLREG